MRNVSLYLCLCFFWSLQPVIAQTENPSTQQGKASYYASKFNGRLTANGETFTNSKLTAAHPSLAFNTLVRVTNVSNGKSVIVRINDRGPHTKARILDLSEAAAKEIDMIDRGIATVHVEIIGTNGQINTEKYTIAALSRLSFKNTAPTPDKKITLPLSEAGLFTAHGHGFSLPRTLGRNRR